MKGHDSVLEKPLVVGRISHLSEDLVEQDEACVFHLLLGPRRKSELLFWIEGILKKTETVLVSPQTLVQMERW